MLNKIFTDTRDSINYKVQVVSKDNNIVILESTDKKTLRSVPLDSFTELLNKEIYKECVKSKAKLEARTKCNKETTAEKIEAFRTVCFEAVKELENYSVKREEAKENKLLLVYENKETKKFRNIAELFIKVRANIISCFIREVELMQNIEYDAELASVHKAHNYNFWIEKSLENSQEAITDFIQAVVKNHKASIASAK